MMKFWRIVVVMAGVLAAGAPGAYAQGAAPALPQPGGAPPAEAPAQPPPAEGTLLDLVPASDGQAGSAKLNWGMAALGAGVETASGENQMKIEPELGVASVDLSLKGPIQVGNNTFVLRFPKAVQVDRVVVTDFGRSKKVTVYRSEVQNPVGNRGWRLMAAADRGNDPVATEVRFPMAAAQALRVDIEGAQAGKIGAIEAFGAVDLRQVPVVEGPTFPRQQILTPVMEATQIPASSPMAGASVLYASGMNSVGDVEKVIDGDALTTATFGQPGRRMVLLDMGKVRRVKRATVLTDKDDKARVDVFPYKVPGMEDELPAEDNGGTEAPPAEGSAAPPGTALMRLLGALPAQADSRLLVPESFMTSQKPLASIAVDQDGTGAESFPTTPTRFILFHFQSPENAPVTVHEITVLTDPTEERLLPDGQGLEAAETGSQEPILGQPGAAGAGAGSIGSGFFGPPDIRTPVVEPVSD